MKLLSEAIMKEAGQLVSGSKRLDYQGIVEHQPAEVAQLHQVMAELNIPRSVADNTLENYGAFVSAPEADRLAIRAGIMGSLSADGLEGRVGLVYNSASKNRTSKFAGAHHQRGIPEFEVVIAPDYAPVPGMHGVFISGTEIMSIILPSDDPTGSWQVVKRKDYADLGQMMEYLALISAGFDLPGE